MTHCPSKQTSDSASADLREDMFHAFQTSACQINGFAPVKFSMPKELVGRRSKTPTLVEQTPLLVSCSSARTSKRRTLRVPTCERTCFTHFKLQRARSIGSQSFREVSGVRHLRPLFCLRPLRRLPSVEPTLSSYTGPSAEPLWATQPSVPTTRSALRAAPPTA